MAPGEEISTYTRSPVFPPISILLPGNFPFLLPALSKPSHHFDPHTYLLNTKPYWPSYSRILATFSNMPT